LGNDRISTIKRINQLRRIFSVSSRLDALENCAHALKFVKP